MLHWKLSEVSHRENWSKTTEYKESKRRMFIARSEGITYGPYINESYFVTEVTAADVSLMENS